jgi:hypothetical protein
MRIHMMSPELKAKWVEALRSGKFKQCRGGLVEGGFSAPDAYCCLGVLWAIEGKPDSLTILWNTTVGDSKQTLINMNDKEGKSFVEIADWIDANLSVVNTEIAT